MGFCGWAQYKNLKNRIGTSLKNSLIDLALLTGQHDAGAYRKGITFRMKALKMIKQSAHVLPNVIVRSSYSGHSATIKTNAETARTEYRNNLLNSDFALVIKGDGNYSYRFYEALSLGRIPVLLDTDCVLPLEEKIDYDSFIIRIDYRDITALDQIIAKRYHKMSSEEFAEMQCNAREAFATSLRTDRFFDIAINTLLPERLSRISDR